MYLTLVIGRTIKVTPEARSIYLAYIDMLVLGELLSASLPRYEEGLHARCKTPSKIGIARMAGEG